jgi:hypothetical protein
MIKTFGLDLTQAVMMEYTSSQVVAEPNLCFEMHLLRLFADQRVLRQSVRTLMMTVAHKDNKLPRCRCKRPIRASSSCLLRSSSLTSLNAYHELAIRATKLILFWCHDRSPMPLRR